MLDKLDENLLLLNKKFPKYVNGYILTDVLSYGAGQTDVPKCSITTILRPVHKLLER